ncbi:MAG: response regulator [Flavobacteriales bacterium]|nr:response regulator [Flavobacteriales bacterium]
MKTILLIEDDTDMRENTSEILELARYRVIQAENGRKGIELAREHMPDLVLCDIMMPELDGYGVLHLLARDPRTAEIPFVFISAKAERGEVRKGMELGADDYLTKPFEESELLNAIEGRLKRSELFRKGFDHSLAGSEKFMDQVRGIDSLKDVGQDRKTRNFERKEVIFYEGDELGSIFLIRSGKVRTYRMNQDGKELVTGLHGPGDYLGYMSVMENGKAIETAETLEPTEVALIPKEDILALLYRDRDVSIRFIKLLTKEVKEKESQLLEMAYASVRQRVAQALLRLHERFGGGSEDSLGVRISREDLATIVGTATESLIRTLTDLKHEGLIEVQGRDIRLRDVKALARLAAV